VFEYNPSQSISSIRLPPTFNPSSSVIYNKGIRSNRDILLPLFDEVTNEAFKGGCIRADVNTSSQHDILRGDPYDFVYNGISRKHRVLKEQNACEFCGAKWFKFEFPSFCCMKGKTKVVMQIIASNLSIVLYLIQITKTTFCYWDNNLVSPSKSMDSNGRAWIVSRNHISQEYTLGLNNFLAAARCHLGVDGRTLCPCNRSEDTWLQRLLMIRAHILRYGMLAIYQRWIHHAKSLSDEEEHDHFEDSSYNDEDAHTLRDVIMDEEGCMFFNVDRSTKNDVEDKSDVNRGRFD
ncbi:hypothetical protein Ccrd_010423, partial [Cynara cardunculus var. scolymus]